MEPLKTLDEKQLAEIEEKLKQTKVKLEKIVKDYPLTSIVIAAGIGYLVAKIFSRGRQ